ncbi:hypothetical protein [Paenibacillus oceani]|uniref:Spore coat protein n=1 Tax=Paenibacillus oceani TaxID=2772510 RepID=A0A927C4K3_9BACL|nr:hypothetical protein [Paenibacillus oceani]MBD2860694.1 hypothetical protein [Paenibacillus oceani]
MKFFGWLGKVLVAAVVAASISVVTTFYVVQHYVQELMKPFQAVLPEKQLGLSEFVAKLWTESNIVGQGGTQQDREENAPKFQTGTSTSPDTSTKTGTGTGTTPPPDDAVAVWSRSGSKEASQKDKVVMSAEQFQTKREKLSEEDKTTVFSLLISRLPQEELQQLSAMMEDGITSAELAEIEKIVENYLKPDEFEKLIGIVNKY